MNNAVMRATLTRIGFSEAAAQAIVEDQGIDSLDEIKLMTDIEIESLCNIVRRPGGTIPAIGGAPGAAAIQNPGVSVNQRAEGHLKLLSFYLRHQARVSRTVTAADITLETIRSVRDLREFESTYKAPTETPTINAKDWPKTMESIEEYLRSYLGERKIPLAMAFLSLYQHFLGPNNVDNMATLAEDKLKNTVYNGEQRRWDFERYVNVHKQQHSIMEGLIEHGYTGIDPRSKVRFLLDGIKTDKFDAVKTRIMSDEASQ
ncbi:hypothetical protein MHU86_8282 [Fragilaria crotonensis]|nr:hypothetical protein MHU86_8282 [Fragilaria crotonensis]